MWVAPDGVASLFQRIYLTDVDKLNAIVDEMREEQQASSARDAEHAAKLEKYRQLLLQDGIDASELAVKIPAKKKTSRPSRPARFRYMNADGKEKTWTGQGRTPSVIAQALEAGKSIEDFRI